MGNFSFFYENHSICKIVRILNYDILNANSFPLDYFELLSFLELYPYIPKNKSYMDNDIFYLLYLQIEL